MPTSVQTYLDLVTSQHKTKPMFMAYLQALIQPMVDAMNTLELVQTIRDIDTAVNVWLDEAGEWVGPSRNLEVPLTGVYFAWGVDGVGWGQGNWKGPYDPSTGLEVLPDENYRTLLKARIAANFWDGTIPGAYEVWTTIFGAHQILIQDNQDMTMTIIWLGTDTSKVTLALLTGGYLDLRPAGVRIKGYFKPSAPGPIFGWGIENDRIAGWGQGSWLEPVE